MILSRDMLSFPASTETVLASNMRRLLVLRSIAIFCELCVLCLATEWLHMRLPVKWIVIVIAAHAVINILSWYRYKRNDPLSATEFGVQLALDTVVLAALLYFSGGYTNPFVSLFLLPLVIAASILPPRFTAIMAVLTIGCYSLLILFYIPLPHDHLSVSGANGSFGLHVLGMWFSFLLSAGLVVFFVVRMSSSLRERDLALAKSREKSLHDEHLVALGTLATGAAHELGTPLSTMAVLVNELKYDHADNPDILDKARIIRGQLDRCKAILSDISATTGQARGEGGSRTTIDSYIREILQHWQLIRPQAQVTLHMEGVEPVPEILTEKTLTQAIINILNNAADASIDSVEVNVYWDSQQLRLDIFDHGLGLDAAQLAAVGTPFYTTKEDGHGLGLYLSRSVIERYKGAMKINNRVDGTGVHVQLILPLIGLEV